MSADGRLNVTLDPLVRSQPVNDAPTAVEAQVLLSVVIHTFARRD